MKIYLAGCNSAFNSQMPDPKDIQYIERLNKQFNSIQFKRLYSYFNFLDMKVQTKDNQ